VPGHECTSRRRATSRPRARTSAAVPVVAVAAPRMAADDDSSAPPRASGAAQGVRRPSCRRVDTRGTSRARRSGVGPHKGRLPVCMGGGKVKRWGRARRHEEVLAADAAREAAGAMAAGRTSKCCRPTATPPSPADRPTHRLPTKPSARARARGSARAPLPPPALTTRSESRPRRPVGSRRRGGEVAEADATTASQLDETRRAGRQKSVKFYPTQKTPPAACSSARK